MTPQNSVFDSSRESSHGLDFKSLVDGIPHFFRHMADLLHLPLYDPQFAEDSLLLRWHQKPHHDLDTLVEVLGFQKGQEILEKNKPRIIEQKLQDLIPELLRDTRDMAMDFQDFYVELPHLGPSTIVLDLFWDPECFLLDPSGLRILPHSREKMAEKILTAVKKLDSCHQSEQLPKSRPNPEQGNLSCPRRTLPVDWVEKAYVGGHWIPYSAVAFMDLIPRLKSTKQVVVVCENGSQSASAALFLRRHKKKLFHTSPHDSSTNNPVTHRQEDDISIRFVKAGLSPIFVE